MSPSAFFDEPTTDIDCGNADQNQHDTTDAARRYVAQGAKFVTGEDLEALAGRSVTLPVILANPEAASSASMATSATASRGQLIGHKDTVQWNNLSQRVSQE